MSPVAVSKHISSTFPNFCRFSNCMHYLKLREQIYFMNQSNRNYFSHKTYTAASNLTASEKSKKKDVSGPYPTAYDPKEVEDGWYDYWEKNNFFGIKSFSYNENNKVNVFSMVLPPPNITGNLHLGHALTITIQDSIARWHRMKGNAVIWIPGYDHGGIATQAIVEKKLLREKKLTKQMLGKEKFIKEVMEWKVITQDKICDQLKKLGSSLDFNRSSFTMDSHTCEAVISAFIQLFEENLIYRKQMMVNWSCEIRSVISDIEVDHIEVPGITKIRIPGMPDPVEVGVMEYFYYPIADSGERLLIGTTRLETMLGDSAVAVHPEDHRYSHMIGKYVKHPFTNENLPIIADESINKEFGSGVMKVTPGHDFKDYDLGVKYKLPARDILTDDGTMKQNIEIVGGKPRFVARQLIRDHLQQMNLYAEKKSHAMKIPICSRTGDIVEPRLKSQWYLDCSSMGKEALNVVHENRLTLIPKYHGKVWCEWFKNLKDWCISRQLWWGHQIPVYQITHTLGNEINKIWVAARNAEEAISKGAQKLNVSINDITAKQDEDVLDTWFSSALFPLTSLGWPTKLDDMHKFYPLTLMETGFDIMFFWVARMVMLGHHLTGKLPFNKVLLHGMVCDGHGRKMTKSLGNIVDPLDIIYGITLEGLCARAHESHDQGSLTPEELKLAVSSQKHTYPNGIPQCGTDGLRFALLLHDIQNAKITVSVKEIHTCRHFCNKIWQGIRFFTRARDHVMDEQLSPLLPAQSSIDHMPEVSQWILSRLSHTVCSCNNGFTNYEIYSAILTLRHFWVHNFCDVYLEYVKPILQSGTKKDCVTACQVMLTCIETFLRCIAPAMPFLSEELYQRLTVMRMIQPTSSIHITRYPETEIYSVWRNTVLEADFGTVMDLVTIARSLKTQHGVSKMRPNVTIAVEEENTLHALERFSPVVATLAHLNTVTFHLTQGQEFFEHQPQDPWVFKVHEHGITVIMDIEGQISHDVATESNFANIRKELDKLSRLVSDVGYQKKALRSVKEKNMVKKVALEAALQKLLNQVGKGEHVSSREDITDWKTKNKLDRE